MKNIIVKNVVWQVLVWYNLFNIIYAAIVNKTYLQMRKTVTKIRRSRQQTWSSDGKFSETGSFIWWKIPYNRFPAEQLH